MNIMIQLSEHRQNQNQQPGWGRRHWTESGVFSLPFSVQHSMSKFWHSTPTSPQESRSKPPKSSLLQYLCWWCPQPKVRIDLDNRKDEGISNVFVCGISSSGEVMYHAFLIQQHDEWRLCFFKPALSSFLTNSSQLFSFIVWDDNVNLRWGGTWLQTHFMIHKTKFQKVIFVSQIGPYCNCLLFIPRSLTLTCVPNETTMTNPAALLISSWKDQTAFTQTVLQFRMVPVTWSLRISVIWSRHGSQAKWRRSTNTKCWLLQNSWRIVCLKNRVGCYNGTVDHNRLTGQSGHQLKGHVRCSVL